MSKPFNPYAPPKTETTRVAEPGMDYWRNGKILVLRQETAFPGRCAKCNKTAHPPARHYRLYRRPRWFAPVFWAGTAGLFSMLFSRIKGMTEPEFLFALSLFLFAPIVAGSVGTRRASVDISLCFRHQWYWRLFCWESGIVCAFMIAMLAYGFTSVPPHPILRSGFLALLCALVLLSLIRPRFTATNIDREFVHLKGCGSAFLASVPEHKGAK